jgi:hypothetical protein
MGALSASAPARSRIVVAPSATFVVYVWNTALAALVAIPMSSPGRLERLFTTDGSAWLEASRGAGELFGLLTSLIAVATLLAWFAGTFFQGLWLHSLASRSSLAEAAAASIRLYPRMMLVSVVLAVPLLVSVAAVIAPPAVLGVVLDGVASERTADIVAIASALPGLFLWFFWRAWHDTARVSVALGLGPFRAARAGLAVLGPRLFAVYTGWSLLAATLAIGGYAIGALGAAGAGAIGVFVLTQVLAFARTLARGRWLAAAIASTR